ncbi:MAG: efflux RND transporter periplasmic adaptor subunit [Pseudomonadota bacterium]
MKLVLKVLLPLLVLVGAGFMAKSLIATKPQVAPTPALERVWTVAAQPATPGQVAPELKVFGQVVAGRDVELRPLVAGRVTEVGPNFIDGGLVRAGDLLVEIDPLDYQAAIKEIEAQIAEERAKIVEFESEIEAEHEMISQLRVQRDLHRRDVERRDALKQKGTGTEKSLDDARLALAQAAERIFGRQQAVSRLSARIDQRHAVVDQLTAALERAKRDLEETRLVAPFDGFLTNTATAVGRRVGVGDLIATLTDADWLEVRFHMSNGDFLRLIEGGDFRGRPARISWRLADREIAYEAEIDRLESEIDAQSGGVQLFARIKGAGLEGVLRPGAFVEVAIAEGPYDEVVRLPESALYSGETVYRIEEGRLTPLAVELVARDGKDILVRGPFDADDLVVTSRFAEIGPGVRVKVQ